MVDRSHVARCHLPHRRETSALTTRGGGAPPHATRGRTFSPCPRLPYTIHSLHTVSGSFTCLHIASGAAEGEGLKFGARLEWSHAAEKWKELRRFVLRRNLTCHAHSRKYTRRSRSARLRPSCKFASPSSPASRIPELFVSLFHQCSYHSCRPSLDNRVNALTLIICS